MKITMYLQNALFALNFSLIFILSGCNSEDKTNLEKSNPTEVKEEKTISNFFKKFKLSTDVEKIVILTDHGCLNCNRKLVVFLDKIKNDPTITIFLEASGIRFDISELSETVSAQTVILSKSEASNFMEIEETSVITIEDFAQEKFKIHPVNAETVDDVIKNVLKL